MEYYNLSKDTVLNRLNTDETHGLNRDTVSKLQQELGQNKLRERKKKTYLERFIEQFKDVMILILIAAAVVSFVIACVEQNPREFFEPLLILYLNLP